MEKNKKNSMDELAEAPRERIPEDVWALIDSDNTSFKIAEICLGHEIEDEETVRKIGSETAKVLIGRIPPKDFEKALKEQLGLSSFLASKIAREINESIFYQVKESLLSLYGDNAFPPEQQSPLKEEEANMPGATDAYLETTPEDSGLKKDTKSSELKGADDYREPIE